MDPPITDFLGKPTACYFNYPHSRKQDFIDVVESYTNKYIIGLERGLHSKKEHYQCVIFTDDNVRFWKNFVQKIFRKLGPLSGKTCEYGKVTKIRNLRKMCAYCLKDGEYVVSGIPEANIQALYNTSFQKKTNYEKNKETKIQLDDFISSFWKLFKSFPTFNEFVQTMFNFCRNKKHRMLSKHRLIREAFEHNCITYELYCDNMGLRTHSL